MGQFSEQTFGEMTYFKYPFNPLFHKVGAGHIIGRLIGVKLIVCPPKQPIHLLMIFFFSYSVRDLKIDIYKSLLELNSGPVVEESCNTENLRPIDFKCEFAGNEIEFANVPR